MWQTIAPSSGARWRPRRSHAVVRVDRSLVLMGGLCVSILAMLVLAGTRTDSSLNKIRDNSLGFMVLLLAALTCYYAFKRLFQIWVLGSFLFFI